MLEPGTVHGGDRLKATTGSYTSFIDGRMSNNVLSDSEVLPAGTRWHDQIGYNRRILGLQFEGDARAGTWKLTRDQ